MNADQIDELLGKTLEDARLSRNEKKALNTYFDQINVDSADLAVWRSRAFALARIEMKEGRGVEVLDWLEGLEKLLAQRAGNTVKEVTQVAAYFTPGDEGPDAIAAQFNHSQTSVDVCVFTITDNRIADSIFKAHRRGVTLRIITDNDKALDLGSDIERLRQAGMSIRTDHDANHMHHKFAIYDRTTLLTGSYNWTRSAAEYNFENFLTTDDLRLVSAFQNEFDRLWNRLG